MEETKRMWLGSRKKSKRKKHRRFVRNIVAYLKSDDYLFAPLFSHSESSKANSAMEMKSVKRRMSEEVKEYLNSDYHLYGPVISSASSLKGKLQITNLVTMEVSTSTTTMREDNNDYSNLRSEITEQTLLHNGRIKTPKQALVILGGGERNGINPESDLSPPEKKMGSPRVTIE